MRLDRLDRIAINGVAGREKPSFGLCLLVLALANGLAAASLWLFGRPLLPPLESLQAWSAGFEAESNSQHLSDPYSFMHAVFGAGLFLFLDGLKPIWPTRSQLVVAVLGSIVWEIVENTPPVIRLFNQSGQPGVYAGDSIVNSLSDTGFVVAGFLLARRVGWRVTLVLAILTEIALSVSIDDGLLLGTSKVLGLM
ncbi:hypothetical protein ASG43_12160 [Aureimonas sp. Leaf454]|uniref:DUF2585 family protein n=1 Tax=Aureimonas sp. Leaf454 TaxID=1736381 RepID=UPI0006F83AE2|nr:DUF2585 family protein [Aureimonas sp. Leaf454]KQT46365.1 hypothetical protein ASG43_12160 [Aureimonas sp. Leaf454]